jgi:4-hydroxy 2-oxovalerate aldolase
MLTTLATREPVILDTTIRDGSYAVNFQYTNDDLGTILGDLDESGIPYLEIGHGVTIGATAAQGRAAQTDEEYFRTARSVVRNAKLGAVIVPALAPIETVDLAGEYLDFLRMYVIASELEIVTPFVERAQSKGLEVHSAGQISSVRAGCAGPCCETGQRYGRPDRLRGGHDWNLPAGGRAAVRRGHRQRE